MQQQIWSGALMQPAAGPTTYGRISPAAPALFGASRSGEAVVLADLHSSDPPPWSSLNRFPATTRRGMRPGRGPASRSNLTSAGVAHGASTRTLPLRTSARYTATRSLGSTAQRPSVRSNTQECQGQASNVRSPSTATSPSLAPPVSQGRTLPEAKDCDWCGQTLRTAKRPRSVRTITISRPPISCTTGTPGSSASSAITSINAAAPRFRTSRAIAAAQAGYKPGKRSRRRPSIARPSGAAGPRSADRPW
jgi:hypothetical protein